MERKTSLSNWFTKMYPFKEDEDHCFVPCIRSLCGSYQSGKTQPIDVAVSFSGPLDMKIDLALKRFYTSTSSSCQPTLALTAIARAMSVWLERVEADLLVGNDCFISFVVS